MLPTTLVSTAVLQGLVVPYGLPSTEEASVANLSTQHLSHPGTVDMSGDMADLTPGSSVSSWPIMGRGHTGLHPRNTHGSDVPERGEFTH